MMHSPRPLSADLLDRYLTGECTPAELRHVLTWLDEHPEHASLIAILTRVGFEPGREATNEAIAVALDLETAWAAVEQRTSGAKTPEVIASRPRGERPSPRAMTSLMSRPKFSASRMAAIGACIAVLLGVGTLLFRHQPSAPPTQRFHTTLGQRTTIRLADGSTVILAPATSVIVSASHVDVTGEAYFSIAPHTARPLVVRTRNTSVRVLGTRFVVRQYTDECESRIVVDEGRVAFLPTGPRTNETTPTVLSARMLARVTDSTVTVTSGVATEAYVGWTEGRLIFDQAALSDVVRELERTYGEDIRITDSTLGRARVSLKVTLAKTSVTQALDVLSVLADAHYTRIGTTFNLVPGRVANPTVRSRSLPTSLPTPEASYGR